MIKQLRIHKIFLTVMILFICTGCDDTVSAVPDEEFDIGIDQKAVIEGNDIEIIFLKVPEDERCPKGAQCVWEGNGRVQILVRVNDSAPEIMELNTSLEPKRARAGDYGIRLLDLQPYPEVGNTITPENYKIRLIVEKG